LKNEKIIGSIEKSIRNGILPGMVIAAIFAPDTVLLGGMGGASVGVGVSFISFTYQAMKEFITVKNKIIENPHHVVDTMKESKYQIHKEGPYE